MLFSKPCLLPKKVDEARVKLSALFFQGCQMKVETGLPICSLTLDLDWGVDMKAYPYRPHTGIAI